jgi:hypothetical protein
MATLRSAAERIHPHARTLGFDDRATGSVLEADIRGFSRFTSVFPE